MGKVVFKCCKRAFDFLSALTLLVVISPLFLILCLLVRVKIGKPIFFRQIRSGRYRKQFSIIKFRTMTNQTDINGCLLPDEKRQTKFGSFLRSTSLDELPELFSIIKGDMSVIGPRPLPPSYDDCYSDRELKRFEVRSGLLPPDSVEQTAIISWNKQLEYEATYAENLSLFNDIRILVSTIRILFKRKETDYGTYVRPPLNEERSSWNTQNK